MTALEIQAVIDRHGHRVFSAIVTNAIQGEWELLECAVRVYQPQDPFRQQLRKAVRWVVERGMPSE